MVPKQPNLKSCVILPSILSNPCGPVFFPVSRPSLATALGRTDGNYPDHDRHVSPVCASSTTYTWAEKLESFERINSMRETNGNFDSCNSCKRLGTSRLHELHESKFPFVSRIEFIRSKLSNFSAHAYGVIYTVVPSGRRTARCAPRNAGQMPSVFSFGLRGRNSGRICRRRPFPGFTPAPADLRPRSALVVYVLSADRVPRRLASPGVPRWPDGASSRKSAATRSTCGHLLSSVIGLYYQRVFQMCRYVLLAAVRAPESFIGCGRRGRPPGPGFGAGAGAGARCRGLGNRLSSCERYRRVSGVGSGRHAL